MTALARADLQGVLLPTMAIALHLLLPIMAIALHHMSVG